MMLRCVQCVTVDRNSGEARGAWFQGFRVTVLRFYLEKIKYIKIGKRRAIRLKWHLYGASIGSAVTRNP